ncbi:unnamed protein product [Arctia plantaginis]|uniref:Alpha 1,4-glycosyltransferase domain-containing protein n=1 Tax=Arctia plantaginis TaxID=874455 RepID=A0A8S1B4X0_ARCPL|nr:unnamed protein product [Arctia plantaginis]
MEALLGRYRRCCVFFLCLCSLYVIIIIYSNDVYKKLINNGTTEKPVIIHWKKVKNKFDCVYSNKDDALPSVEDAELSTKNNSIFFIETSCRGGINSRVACAVESAARLHPNRQVNFLFMSPITEQMLKTSNLKKLRDFGNIKLLRIHIKKYIKGTVVENILLKPLKRSKYPIEHASDILRIIALNKYGGVYLDTDSILIKNLDSLPPNFIGKELPISISSGIIGLSKDAVGSNLTMGILKEIQRTYKPKIWSSNGPKAIQRVLQRLCPKTLFSTDDCGGLKIYPPKYFYPVHYTQHKNYFKNGNISNMYDPYMHHMWNHFTGNLKVGKASPFAKLARKFCPTIYEMYDKDDALPSVEDAELSTKNNSIFFIETSCRGGINSRAACAVESAARLHPNRQVNFLFMSPITEQMLKTSNLNKLRDFENIKLLRIHIKEYIKGTVVENILLKPLKRSKYPIEHASDILRIIALNKYGGVYLDTDSILIKNLDSLPPNFIGKELPISISSGIIGLSKDAVGSNLTMGILKEIQKTYKPKIWSSNGPKAIQRVLQRLCPKTLFSTDDCGGLKIYPPKYFYPVHYTQHKNYFKNGNISNMYDPYMHHMWNHFTGNLKVGKASPFAKLARKFCPTIYEMYGDEFEEYDFLPEENELSCHYLKDEGAVRALDELVKFQPNAIYFIESSCEGLTSRQTCSIESAAIAHPDRQIIVLLTSPVSWEKYKTNGLSVIMQMANTEAVRIHIEDFGKGTPFYSILKKKPLTVDDINTNIGDILKYVTMYKYSGIYLGLDVLVASSFDDLNDNWIVKDGPASISADMFSFSDNKNGRLLAEMVLNIVLGDVSLPQRQGLWTFDNCKPMNKLANLWCTSSGILHLNTSVCRDLQVMEPDGFLPIPVHERLKYFDDGEWTPSTNETIHTYQTFDYLTKYNIVPNNSLYDMLAQTYCPAVYEFYAIDERFNPPDNSIYFHETSCTGKLNSRQACAVESAARVHPDRQVNLLFTGPVKEENLNAPAFNALKKYENVKVLRLHLVDYAKWTPLEDLVSGGALNRTRWRISHTSDVLRFLSLYKWGGIYLDLDVVVVRSFDDLAPNWAARDSDKLVASGALSFSKDALGREIADLALRDLKDNYRGDVWDRNGPGVITKILQTICSTNYLPEMSASTCLGFEVYAPELFYPVTWLNAADYFEEKELDVEAPYTYHVWNKFTAAYKVNSNSVYAKLAQKYYPEVYEMFGDNFGL